MSGPLSSNLFFNSTGTSLVSVGNSALFKQPSSQTLSRSLGSAGNRRTFTISVWINPNLALHAGSAYNPYIYGVDAASSNDHGIQINNEAIRFFNRTSGTFDVDLRTNGLVRDIGWLHIVAALDTTASVNRAMLYINGTEASLATNTQPSLNLDTLYNNSSQIIGGSSGKYFDGYMAEFVMVEGSQLGPTSFGEFDSTGLFWTPKSSADIKALTFGTNGFYLDNTTNAQTDASGEGNNFTNNNSVTTTTHTPTNLNAVLNSLQTWSAYSTISNGNRTAIGVTSYSGIPVTIPVNMGGSNKWYMEFLIDAVDSVYPLIGVAPADFNFNVANAYAGSSSDSISYQSGGLKITGGSTSSYGASFAASDVIGMLITESTGTVQFWKQTSGSGSFADQGNIVTGYSGEYLIAVLPKTSAQLTLRVDSSEWGNSSPPAGAKALTTTNLASETTRTASDSKKYFDTILYEGNGDSQRVGQFQPFTDSFTVSKGALGPATGYLSRTFDEAGDRQKFTLSTWFKIGVLGANEGGGVGVTLFSTKNGSANSESTWFVVKLDASNRLVVSIWNDLITTKDFNDTSQWYHLLVAVDTTQSTAADRIKVYINGVQEIWFDTTNYPSSSASLAWGVDSTAHYIGARDTSGDEWQGYLSQTAYITGTQLTPSSFGQTDTSSNRWVPKDISGLTFGSAGFFLDYADSGNVGDDESGNTNDFTNVNTVAQVTDSPTINVATLDPNSNVTSGGTTALSNGNRTSTQSSGGTTYVGGTLVPESGKFVWEVTVTNVVDQFYIGIKDILGANPASSSLADDAIMYQNDGTIDVDGTTYSSSPATYTDGDVIRVEWDVNVKIEWFKNDSTQGSYTLLKSPITYKPFFVYNDDTASFTVNFGSSSFAHTPTTGYSALTQDNLTSTDQFISAFSWIKNRDATDSHMWLDRVRGIRPNPYHICSNTDATQVGTVETIRQMLAGGVVVGNNAAVNTANESYVLWNFMMEATGSGSSNEDGSINTTATLVDTTLGMSISTYTGTGSNATVGHGLGVAPEVIIVKEITGGASNWQVYNESIGNTKVLYLNLTLAAATDSAFQDTSPTSTVFSIGTGGDINGSGNTYVAYCFAPSQFISIGSFVANANADGPFIPTINSLGVPIQPVWVLFKNASSGSTNWQLFDTARDPYNSTDQRLFPNDSSAEGGSGAIDIDTGGVKIRNASYDYNSSAGNTITYMTIGTPIIDTDGKIIAGKL
jgi:hypothetical protein